MTNKDKIVDTPKIDSIENMEHYMLYGRGEIMQKTTFIR